MPYPKRLIEVDLPIKRISAHARREKSIRHGHISTLHIWWARRPLAACRAVICASLWPDPVDELCPQVFREQATKIITAFAKKTDSPYFMGKVSEESSGRWNGIAKGNVPLDSTNCKHWNVLRYALLDFIADFANWDNSTHEDYLETSRALTQLAHEALGGEPGTRPLVVDPFAGGGSIPLEALRVGADAFASDLNPVAVLLNKVVLEYIPKYGQRLADEVRKWGQWVKEEAEKELAEFYPKDPDGSTPIAYLWARMIQCEGPACGIEIPLIRSTTINRKNPITSLDIRVHDNEVRTYLNACAEVSSKATIKQGKASCPKCGYTTSEKRVKAQLREVSGGGNNARLLAVLVSGDKGRKFREPNQNDFKILEKVKQELQKSTSIDPSLLPLEDINPLRPYKNTVGVCIVTRLGISHFCDLYTHRQSFTNLVLQKTLSRLESELINEDKGLLEAIITLLNIAFDRLIMQNTSLSRWNVSRSTIEGLFSKQALQVVWDFAESNPLGPGPANWDGAVNWIYKVIEQNHSIVNQGIAIQANALECPLPDDSAELIFTDPPYFAAVPYADLADVFYVWLKKGLISQFPNLFSTHLIEKTDELIVTNSSLGSKGQVKDPSFFSDGMTKALDKARAIAKVNSVGCIVFADSSTAAWESMLSAVIEGGWVVTASWAIDTEMQNRTRAQSSASLQSSVFMICRPRENFDGSLRKDIGDWRDVLQELPHRIHDWMPRLAQEGVVGADAIFACLGPALEIFSRYSSVEKASGEEVTLREYLEYVWGAVSKEALGMIFTDADTTDFEEDARLTAMWLWTLSAGVPSPTSPDDDDDSDDTGKPAKSTGYTLEYDAARKIAQGLGAHLDKLTTLVEIKGDKARLLPVGDRAQALFGKEDLNATTTRRKKKNQDKQLDLFAILGNPEDSDSSSFGDPGVPQVGKTVLDRLHQSMILFAAGRSEALKRFLVEDGIGADQRYWKLAQAFSALYPTGTDEKRWVDGVLARKKGLGF